MSPPFRYIVLLLALWSISPLRAGPVVLPSNFDDVELIKVREGVYVLHGLHAMPDHSNSGLISNAGVILTNQGVVIVDSGGSYKIGKLLLREIEKITDLPVVAVLNSHVHGDHWLGNLAIREEFPAAKFYAHKKAIDRLQNGDAESWKGIMEGLIGSESPWSSGVFPDDALEGGEKLHLGNMVLVIHHTGHAHTDSDLIIESPHHKLVFTGDVVEFGRAVSSDVPQDFDIKGQIEAIKYILELPVDIYVPGHGETGGKEIPEAALKFLEILHESVKRNYDAGLEDFEMKEQVIADMAEFSGWYNFDQLGRMISYVYQQVEAAEFD